VSYSVRVLPRGKTDLRRIFFYIEQRSPEGAIRWEEALESGLDRLSSNPMIYGLAPEDDHFGFDRYLHRISPIAHSSMLCLPTF
jgi:plasmid stabilization system protein ParE